MRTAHLIEFTDGFVEVLPMPTMSHQMIVLSLIKVLEAFIAPEELGTVLFAGMKNRLRNGKYRESDVLFMLAEHADRMSEQFWVGADPVMEIVSDENRRHDLETKRVEYAQAGIPEYWIVDPLMAQITVLTFVGDSYAVHGEFPRGERATSVLLAGFEVEVTAALAARA